MNGASAVVALVLIEWTTGWIGTAAWSQSWKVIKRGHFRITAWITGVLAIMGLFAYRAAAQDSNGAADVVIASLATFAVIYLLVQYSRTDLPGAVVGVAAGLVGATGLALIGDDIPGWPTTLAVAQLVAGTLLLGAVMNGMMLGHWYLNQPGLKPWALARLTDLALAAVVLSLLVGLVAGPLLAGASTEGAVLGLPGFGRSFGVVFYLVWVALIIFTGAVVWAARRCVQIRSIQSATGLFYVAVLSAGVAEFVVRYLMLNAQ